MAFNIGPLGAGPAPEPEAPKIYSDNYHHPIIESVYQNENSLLSMVQGTPVLIEYYRQVLREQTEPHAFQPGSGVYQQYTRIKQLIIKETDFSFEFDDAKGLSLKRGTAYVIFGLVPIKGDVFIADIGDGNAGFFTIIEQPKIAEFTANKVYQISYVMQGILSKTVFEELNSYVVEELVYSRDQHLNGGNPIISHGEYDLKKDIESWEKTIVHHIYQNFYWDEERSLALKDGTKHYYDPYLVKAFLAMARTDTRATYPKINTFSMEYGGNLGAQHGVYNIWDVMFRSDWNLLGNCKKGAWVIDPKRLYSTRLYANIRATLYDGVVVTDPENFADLTGWVTWNDVLSSYVIEPDKKIEYLFSADFYEGKPASEFEELVVAILKDDIVDLKRLKAYLETYWNLSPWQQLYYGTILLLLIYKSRKMGKTI